MIKRIILVLFLFTNSIWAKQIKTPEKDDITGFGVLFKKIIDGFVDILIPVAVIAYVYVGFLFVSSNADPKKLESAKSALFWVTVGVIVIIGGKAVYELALSALGK